MLTRCVLAALSAGVLLAAPAVAAPAPPPLHQGRLITGQGAGRCLTGGPVRTVLHNAPCHSGNDGQKFYQNSAGHFNNIGNCVQPDSPAAGAKVRVAACTFDGGQDWWYTTTLRAGRNGRCLTETSVGADNRGQVRLRDCSAKPNRRWRSVF